MIWGISMFPPRFRIFEKSIVALFKCIGISMQFSSMYWEAFLFIWRCQSSEATLVVLLRPTLVCFALEREAFLWVRLELMTLRILRSSSASICFKLFLIVHLDLGLWLSTWLLSPQSIWEGVLITEVESTGKRLKVTGEQKLWGFDWGTSSEKLPMG